MPNNIALDVARQGLPVSVEEVEESFGLWRRARGFDPAWRYDPDAARRPYAPTAAEMYPDEAPEGWPG